MGHKIGTTARRWLGLPRVPRRRGGVSLAVAAEHVLELFRLAQTHARSTGHPTLVYVHALAEPDGGVTVEGDCQCSVCSERRALSPRRLAEIRAEWASDDERHGTGRRTKTGEYTQPGEEAESCSEES